MLTVEVLQRFPEARERWAKAFRYVLVDEYQDTNHAQYVLLQLLAGEHRNLMVVGDPDQCVVEGTLITMARRHARSRSRKLWPGTRCFRVTAVVSSALPASRGHGSFTAAYGIAITTASGSSDRYHAASTCTSPDSRPARRRSST